jgi:NAD(P)-dependent dehydrogenase (short-subunit alcohol dehydrogenase family)
MSITFYPSSKQDFVKIFETNVGGVSDVTQAFLPLLRKRGQDKVKKILNISSILGSVGLAEKVNPSSHAPAYAVSKAALNMLTKATANHLAKENFIVYSAHPGWVKTDMGGENAQVEQVDSIAGMLKVLDKVTVKDNGHFFNYTGEELSW